MPSNNMGIMSIQLMLVSSFRSKVIRMSRSMRSKFLAFSWRRWETRPTRSG